MTFGFDHTMNDAKLTNTKQRSWSAIDMAMTRNRSRSRSRSRPDVLGGGIPLVI